jgi:hypothetical protein
LVEVTAFATPPETELVKWTGAPQVYVVPSGTNPSVPFVGVTTNEVPVHIVRLIVLIAGAGLTNTVRLNTAPVHAPNDGVTKYTTVNVELVLFVKVPVIFPVALVGPDTVIVADEAGKLQLYTVFTGTIPSVPFVVGVGVTMNTPLQIVVLNAGTNGFGSIGTSTLNWLPTQLPACGVTVY